MPVAQIYSTERVIHVEREELALSTPAIHHVKKALRDVPSDFQVFEADTLTDITPQCFKSWSDKEILPDTRFMLSVAKDGESGLVQMIPGEGAIRKEEEDIGNVSAEQRYCVVGHENELGWYIGGLVLHLPLSQVKRFAALFGTSPES